MRADEPGALTDAELLERSCPSPGNREGKGGLALLLAPTLGSLVSAAPGGTRGAVIWHLLDRTQTNSQQARSFTPFLDVFSQRTAFACAVRERMHSTAATGAAAPSVSNESA